MTRRWGHAMGEDDDENIAGGRAGGHSRCPVPALVLVACVLFGQACICDAQLSPSSDIAMVRRDEGVCNGVDIRNDVSTFDRLRGCRVIEGSLQIVLMDADEEKLTNYTFPELREITGYLLLYRVQGLRSLSRLFPNLAVIRGDTLFFNFALVIYEMKNLQEVGLHSLTHVIRGAVNIERNSLLCYVDTIDWGHIAKHGKELHVVSGNRQRNECPGCVETCSKSPTKNEPLCWNRQHCQKVTSSCPENSNCSSKMCNENGTCCHENCIGGCFGEGADNCVACKNVYWNGKCITKCPFNTYEYLNRRCIEEAECRSMKVSETADESAKLKSMIPFNNSCTAQCPANHQETIVEQDGKPVYLSKDVEKRPKYTCKPCHGSQCRKECDGINVDSIQAAQRLRGCTHITGGLEITLRGGKNFVRELEENLNSIQEIEHYLKIVRTSPIVSLNFLRNLTTIHGKKLEQEKYAFVVKDNINLQELWDWNTKKSFRILNGKLFFHNNPKLCFNKIVQLKEEAKMPDFTDTEVARDSNGDKIACNVTVLEAGVKVLGTEGVILEWKSYKHHDSRELLGYVIYYTEAPSKNITLFDGRDACGNDGWIVDDVSVSPDSQEENHLIAHMKPYTQYAYYIKTYMISTGGSGAQSPLQYFRTKPSIPSVPRHLRAYSNSSSEIVVQWLPPSEPNGNITHYIVEAIFEGHDANFLDQRDYCKDKMLALVPEKKSSLPPIITIVKDEKLGGLGEKGSCPCAAEEKKSQHTDEQEAQYQITFEDYLQNNIYYKRPANNRRKREISNLSALTESLQVVDMVKIEFPNDKNGPATPEPPYQLANKQDRGKYIHYRTEVKETIAVIRQLKHFGGYSISVSACREIVAGEVNANACSTVSMVTARTMKLDNADDLEVTKIHTEVGNSTQDSYGKVKVRWEEPEEPNGIIVAYVLEYRRVEPLLKPIQECISRQDYQSNGNSFVIGEAGSLEPGNYSISIRATSLAGQGVPTALRYFTIEKSPSKSSQYLILIIIVSGFVVILAFGLLLQNHRKKTHLANMKIIATVNPEYISTIYVPDEWEVPRKKIEFVKELGQGSFGMVYEGIVRDIQGKSEAYCAIKTAGAQATDRERMDFLKEASVMKEFKTHHVVQLLGVVSQGCPELPALVIMELMANGDLKTYLRSHRPDETNDPNIRPPSLKKTLQMAVEIADGMAYLAFKKFVHRDLAARNCMVASDLTVKIGDFGMTRDIYDTDYYRKDTKGLLPVRWMAPESLRDGIFTSSSDVWSYGVVLWEMATLALQPYQGLSNDQVLKYVSDGGTMEPPENCPKRLFELMHLCWKKKPQHRPSFLELVTRLLPESVENFHEVSFYHQPEHKDLRDSAMATVLAKTKARAITTPPQPVEQENFHIENSEDEEEVGERAALTSSSRGGGSPLRPPPSIMQTSTASANNNGPKVVNGGGGGGSGQANGFLGGYNHRNHTNHHNHGLNHSASSSSEPHKTTEC